ncbi:MAG: radical SAM protein [Candidatus Omnitrophica bacterium]|nr:radical SAM protein [Candidatus Omnitrophota bacterium]
MKIALVQCPCAFGTAMPGLGLAYLSSCLKKNGHSVELLDLNIVLYGKRNEKDRLYWDSSSGYHWYLIEPFKKLPFIDEQYYEDCVNRILSCNSDILGFSVQNTSVLFTLEIIKRIKLRKPSQRIILGGPNCYNISGEDTDFKLHHGLEEYADIIVIGEGENTLLDILRRIEAGITLDGLPGTVTPKEGRWVFNGLASSITNLDELPDPDFAAYDLSAYTDRSSLPVITSRGCVMRCVFCTDTYFWINYRCRSAQNVVAEIMRLRQEYRNRFVSFNDSLVNGNYDNFVRLCELLIAKRVGINWGGNCRVDKRFDRQLLKKMRRSGCEYLILGLESASNKILKMMHKGFSREEASIFIWECSRAGIEIVANWIVGFPGETDEDFKRTADFISGHRKLIKKNTFSTLTINQFSYLQKHKDEFGIVLDGPHLGLWNSQDGCNNFELRNSRLRYLEKIENKISRDYGIVRQVGDDGSI